jgi:predicted dehydrogenase
MAVDYRAHWQEVRDGGPFKNPYRIGWENFLRHVAIGAPLRADFAAGVRDVQFAEACHRSVSDGRWVDISPDARELQPAMTDERLVP